MFDNDPAVLKKKQSVIDVGQRTQLDLLQGEVRRNKEVLTNMRLENTQLNIALQQAIRGQRRITNDEYFRKEEEQLHNKLCVLKRSLNSVKGKKEELAREIERTIEETNYIIKEGDATIDENSALGQKIRALENRLDKCLIKHNEVNAIRRTYETLLERLQQEQSGFDTRLAAMEKTLQNKEKDLADLNSVASEASRGRDAAKAEVLSLKTQLTRERREQKKDLEERKAFVSSKRTQLEKKSRRLREKMEKDEERRMRARLALSNTQKKKIRVNPQKQLQPEELEHQQQLREAYNRLKEVTMSTNVGDVVFKLKERQDANVQLLRTVKEAEEKNEGLLEERRKLQEEWNDMQQQCGGTNRLLKSKNNNNIINNIKNSNNNNNEEPFDNSGMTMSSVVEQRALVRRRVLEEFDAHLCDRQNELEETRMEQEWLAQLLVDVDTGVRHLAERLEGTISTTNSIQLHPHNPQQREISISTSTTPTPAAAADGISGSGNRRGDSEVLSPPAAALTFPRESVEITGETGARGSVITELLRVCGVALQRMLDELHEGDVESTAKCLAHWRGTLPASNIHVRLEHYIDNSNKYNTQQQQQQQQQHLNNNNNNNNNLLLYDVGGDSRHEEGEDELEMDDLYERNGRQLSAEEPGVAGRKWLGAAAARNDLADDFPENEIHDRRELKMMSIATVERERKKARKQQQQRTKEDSA
ncbi:uncharacterized protein TM35_000181560 [Trypanosoma theileri]|uniref:ODAD1 central coiled coil region domain-containing protein n=1 Tax=Trypanosoma theileri TaxID=67003 RepID=A0A1X0NV64_9TRYP|nr:uncharacterized protein TM35_000181560 [Trypanosoma theileri]ORC88099.1 hypothetical protein TM35_000181560 [Trypanosoma theileri]